ncbi:AtzE family amidohydrolase [Falsiroseomonas stagni]|uniref:Aspartyl-tRNA(Asn)/glutamyl-tRNA(Gln) amidotransferase subunit A n=1 Tax=Falsiroseomonas stagni DSM 19981 TaxID=1123062 RepID=A0A1I4C0Y2_9PROT|nr:AtzE family amidohydrolase [Falsiroseomonas stagni]SFK74712.1 aspartyl-tRNA(Asn)/glutamyl-tRNA(Gln) amidotransferase subunit A [Falsiroseomonas stagni DSM 19981]
MNAARTAAAIRAGTTTAVAVVEATLADIAARDGALTCFTAVTADRARAEAAAVDAAIAAGRDPGPLAGVPLAVKNLFDLEGLPTLAGSKIRRDAAPAMQDAFAVQRLRAAGAVVIGATNMDEFAFGFSTENAHAGPTRNPHDPARIAGGSSGGSAAAVAAGLTPIGIGSDTNGSIRVPAGLCGIWGLKPTYGRLSRRGAHLFAGSFDHVGPFARSLDDLALVHDAMQGEDPADPAQAPRAIEPVSGLRGLGGIRFGIAAGYFERGGHAEALAPVGLAAAVLGATTRIAPDLVAEGRAAAMLITLAEGANLHLPSLRRRADDFDPLTRDRFLAGALLPAHWITQAQRVRAAWARAASRIFDMCDVLVAPLLPCVAPPIGTAVMEVDGATVAARPHLGVYTQPFSAIGLPAMAVPLADPARAGATLPVGLQLVAPPWREDLLFRAAAALADAGLAGCPTPPPS